MDIGYLKYEREERVHECLRMDHDDEAERRKEKEVLSERYKGVNALSVYS